MLILHAARFTNSTFLAELRAAPAGAERAPCEAIEAGAGNLARARKRIEAENARVIVLGLPRLARSLAALIGDRLTLIVDGADGIDERSAERLKDIRVASFSFPLFTALRNAGADAAFFTWAPPSPPARELNPNEIFVEAGAWPRPMVSRRIASALPDARFAMRRPRNWREFVSCLLCKGAAALAPDDAAQAEARAEVFLASGAQGGLDGGFLPAMARGAVVIAPGGGLFTQYLTHGVSGLIGGGDISVSQPQLRMVGAAAKRTANIARLRFEEDRERLRAFVNGERLAQKTTARVDWPPARATEPAAPADAREGGNRLRGVLKTNAPDAPLITVAIVIRNARASFAPTLASACAQDYPNIEIIAVDGDSSDGTRDEIAARDLALDYWISEPDRGPYDGMNKAARLARGRYLIFMNAGDFFAHERAISEAFSAQDARAADIVVGHHVYVDAMGVERLCKNADFTWTYERLSTGELSWDWWNGAPCGQAVFIRVELLKERPFSMEYRIAADHDFLYEACARGRRFFHCDSVIGVYTSGGLSGANDRKTAAELLRIARVYGPREKVDAWFKRNLPIAFDEK